MNTSIVRKNKKGNLKKKKGVDYTNLYRVLLIVLLTIAVGVQGGLKFTFLEASSENTLRVKDIQKLYPKAARFQEREDKAFDVFNKVGDTIGRAILSSTFAKGIKGFAGEVPVLIGMDTKGIITKMVLLRHHESEEYMEYIVDEKLLEKWNNITYTEALQLDVDAITAATETSNAIIKGVAISFASYAGQDIIQKDWEWKDIVQFILTLVTILFALAVCFIKKLKKYRTIMLVLVAVVMGFLYKSMLSISMLYGWLINGLPWGTNLLLVLVLLLSIILPFTTKKQFYCGYMCPYGAAQELAGKASPFKKRSMKWLKWKGVHFQKVAFVLLLVGLLTGVFPELSFIEPFPSFSITVVSWWMIAFGGVFIILSMFYSKPWCQICPTGFLFDSCKKSPNSKKVNLLFNMKTSEILNLLLVVVIILLLLKVTKREDEEVAEKTKEEIVEVSENKKKETKVEISGIKKSYGKRPIMYPMPALVIGSYNKDGQPNIMTAAWGGIVNSRPLSIGVSLREATQTYKNVMETGAFTINYASTDLVVYADWIGEISGKHVNKFEKLGLTPVKSELVNAPYVKEFPVIVECRVIKSEKLGRHTQFIGEVIDVKVDESCLNEKGKIDISKVRPVIYGGGGYYSFGSYLGRPGKMHKQLGIEIERED